MPDAPLLEYAALDAAGQLRWTLRIDPGQSTGVTGRSGIGKTTLLRSIARTNLGAASPVRLAYLPQDPRDLFPAQLPTISLAMALAGEQADPDRFWANCDELLAELGLDPNTTLRADSASLSGGEIQRAAIAILLATEPTLLLADEPTASLDGQAKNAVAQLLVEQRRKLNLAVLVTSHSSAFLVGACDRILNLTEAGLAPLPLAQIGESVSVAHVSEATPAVLDISISRHMLQSPAGRTARVLLRDFTRTLRRGVVYGVVGPSGAGKSTLLRLMAGHEQPTHGRVTRLAAGSKRPFAILVPQNAQRFFDPRRSMEAHARLLAGGLGGFSETVELSGILGRLDIAGGPAMLARRAGMVSGGEAQRLAAAVALWLRPQLLCFDEIDTGVPPALKHTLGQMIRDNVSGHANTAVLVSHDLEFLDPICDQLIELG